jgi:hypothetical protein
MSSQRIQMMLKYFTSLLYRILTTSSSRSQWLRGLRRGRWPLGRWDCGFESRLRHWCLSSSAHRQNTLVTLSPTLYRESVVNKAQTLNPWSRVFLEKPVVRSANQEITAFYGNKMYITVFTAAHFRALCWTRSNQYTPLDTISLKSAFYITLPFTLGSSKYAFTFRFFLQIFDFS